MQRTTSSFLPQVLINCISANVHNVKSACMTRVSAAMQSWSLLCHSLVAASVTRWWRPSHSSSTCCYSSSTMGYWSSPVQVKGGVLIVSTRHMQPLSTLYGVKPANSGRKCAENYKKQRNKFIITARCYASAVLAMDLCPSVSVCLCPCLSQAGVLLKRQNVDHINNTTR